METLKNKKAIIFISIGLVLVIVGSINGDFTGVMNKAANICLECIGIG